MRTLAEIRAQQNRWVAANKEHLKIYRKARREKDRVKGNAAARARRAKNADAINMRRREWRKSNPAKAILVNVRAQAKRRGVTFNLTEADIKVPEFCPVLGIKLEFGVGTARPNSPSLDKVKPELGYTPGNVVVMSHRANTLKSDATVTEIRAVADWLEAQEAK